VGKTESQDQEFQKTDAGNQHFKQKNFVLEKGQDTTYVAYMDNFSEHNATHDTCKKIMCTGIMDRNFSAFLFIK
jgi:hypothetical protein